MLEKATRLISGMLSCGKQISRQKHTSGGRPEGHLARRCRRLLRNYPAGHRRTA